MNDDPASTDASPHAGSVRYLAIKERAMSTTTRPRRAAPLYLRVPAFAVVLVALVVTVAVLIRSDEPVSAAQRVAAAAERTGSAVSLRAVLRYDDGRVARAVVDGRDVEVREGGDVYVTVGGKAYERGPDGRVRVGVEKPDETLAPFAEASEAVVLAALESDGVTEVGTGTVRGQAATHYRIVLDTAARSRLRALSPGVLGWFELEYPDQVSRIDVWVRDRLIHRIDVEQRYGPEDTPVRSTTEFFDFGAEVEIVPPR